VWGCLIFTAQSALAVPLPAGISDQLLVTQTTNGNTVVLFDSSRDLNPNPFVEGGTETFTLTPPPPPGITQIFLPGVSIGLLESDGTTPSDLITTSADGLSLTFTSDIEGQPLPVPGVPGNIFVEDPNNPLNITNLVLNPDVAAAGVQVSVQSDGDGAAPIPEPTTIALFGLGLGVLWVVDRKRRRS